MALVDGMGRATRPPNRVGILWDLESAPRCRLDYNAISFLNSALFLAGTPTVSWQSVPAHRPRHRAGVLYRIEAPPSLSKERRNVLVVRAEAAAEPFRVSSVSTSEPLSGDFILVSDGVFRSGPIPARAGSISSRDSGVKTSLWMPG